MDHKYGLSVRARRRAAEITQDRLASAIDRSQGWVARLEHLQIEATAEDKRRIESFLAGPAVPAIPRASREQDDAAS